MEIVDVFPDFSFHIQGFSYVNITQKGVVARRRSVMYQFMVHPGDEIKYFPERNAYYITKSDGTCISCQEYFSGPSDLFGDYIFSLKNCSSDVFI